ncbi:MAG: hypothetical protein LQ340_002262 [Diploschistes diacapsis]|nr:MAG: hypothetical protein LQ340_002262 [Diploschistes diacapsis]
MQLSSCHSLLLQLLALAIQTQPSSCYEHRPEDYRSPYPLAPLVNSTDYDFYPWQPHHDKAQGRVNHLSWQYFGANAWCIHAKPFSRAPANYPLRTNSTRFLPENCTKFLHEAWDANKPRVMRCGDAFDPAPWPFTPEYPEGRFANNLTVAPGDALIDPTAQVPPYPQGQPKKIANYTIYLSGNFWNNLEHCRAGCETCFDAMEETGAEQAICRRSVERFPLRFGRCGMGVIRGNDLPLDCGLKADSLLDGIKQTEKGGIPADVFESEYCNIDWNPPRWKELGYASLDQALNAGLNGLDDKLGKVEGEKARSVRNGADVRVYYQMGFEKIGAELGVNGKRRIAKGLLKAGGTAAWPHEEIEFPPDNGQPSKI